MSDRHEENLARLRQELLHYANLKPSLAKRHMSADEDCERFAAGMPLCHSCGSSAFQQICSGKDTLMSTKRLVELGIRSLDPRGSSRVEELLGTIDNVFTFAGPFRYPYTECGFLFTSGTEHSFAIDDIGNTLPAGQRRATASPFDTGGIIDYLLPNVALANQIQFHRRHEIPVPDYRSYFRETLSILFSSPWHYLDGTGPDDPGPIEVKEGDDRRWTFEVRFKSELPLPGNLLAVFLPTRTARQSWAREKIAAWKRDGVGVDIYVPNDENGWGTLLGRSILYITDYLHKLR